ncbi:MAG TPA: sirohydrochlorin chelatase [Acidimicrobiales bacterium]|nr:sirohydrochlorin chelatase [Acidimicrobiales bacterium]
MTVGREALLLVGHGSRSEASDAEMHALHRMVAAALPEVDVALGFLEMSEPPAGRVIDELVAAGASRVVVLPLVLFGAGHAKSDVPAIVVEARSRHTQVDIRFGSPLGLSRPMVSLLGHSLERLDAARWPLLVVARGTSDPDANGDAAKAGRLLAEWNRSEFHLVAFTGVTGPSVPEALDMTAALGHRRLAVAFWFLCTGRLVERARRQLGDFARQEGVDIIDAGYFGPRPEMVPIVLERYRDALEGRPVVNCDACAYRAAWPGRADRVGQPVGVGHSDLAEEHRHSN